MTPAGHISGAYISTNYMKKLPVWAILFGGILPDLDIIVFFLPDFWMIHRTVSHNFLFIFFFVILTFIVYFKRDNRLQLALGVLVGSLIHLFLDSFLDGNSANGIGIPLFWPFTDKCYIIHNFMEHEDKILGWGDYFTKFSRNLIVILIFEFPLYLGAIITFIYRRKKLGLKQ